MSKAYKLSDYKVLDYFVKHVDLELDFTKDPIQSKSALRIEANPQVETRSVDLRLDGEYMELTSISLDGKLLPPEQYLLTNDSQIIKNVPQDRPFTLETTTTLREHSDLFGVYKTEGTLLVKAETQGMRRVYFGIDRPDNLATYRTTIIAHETDYPVLLSNGELVEQKKFADGTHAAVWLDTTPKPTYLFALVAGVLQKLVSYFQTRTGRILCSCCLYSAV